MRQLLRRAAERMLELTSGARPKLAGAHLHVSTEAQPEAPSTFVVSAPFAAGFGHLADEIEVPAPQPLINAAPEDPMDERWDAELAALGEPVRAPVPTDSSVHVLDSPRPTEQQTGMPAIAGGGDVDALDGATVYGPDRIQFTERTNGTPKEASVPSQFAETPQLPHSWVPVPDDDWDSRQDEAKPPKPTAKVEKDGATFDPFEDALSRNPFEESEPETVASADPATEIEAVQPSQPMNELELRRVRAREMKAAGASVREIAKELGVAPSTAHSYLKAGAA